MTLYAFGPLSLVYLVSALVLGGLFIWHAIRLLRNAKPRRVVGVYTYSLLYLGLFFAAIMADTSIGF